MTHPRAAGPIVGEAEIIAILAPLTARFPGAFALTDDCAMFAPEPGSEIVLNTDAVAAGVHFFADDAAADIAWKALAVNVSYLTAKGARPRVYLMALAFPEAPQRAWVEDFARGLAAAQEQFGLVLAGGDTDRRPGPLSVTIAAIGEVPTGAMVRRGAARPGDVLYVSGQLGDAALGLMLRRDGALAARWGLDAANAEALVARYFRPAPRIELAPVLRAHARAALDLSDGLVKDLGRMAAASGCGAAIDGDALPLSAAARIAFAADPALRIVVLSGGDDYEVLAAVAPDAAAAFEAAAGGSGVAVTAIGVMTDGSGVRVHDRAGRTVAVPADGWDHF
ncbi:MAG: thiamine-phosphate kinase [Hyphomicrobium sp.]